MNLDIINDIKNRVLIEHCFDLPGLIAVSSLAGLAAGMAATAFQNAIDFLHNIFFTGGSSLLFPCIGKYYIILLPAAGAFIVSLIVKYLASATKKDGVPEVIHSVAKNEGLLPPRLIIDKFVTVSIIIGSGGSVGKEGPIVQIGAAIGSAIGQIFKLPSVYLKTLVACGAAGGIAAAFNAPLGGIMFAQEIILKEFRTGDFIIIAVSSVVSTLISRKYAGETPAFIIPEYHLGSTYEMILFAILGILAGLFAVLYIKTLYKTGDIFSSLNKIPAILKPVAGGLLMGSIGFYFPQVFGLGYDTVTAVLYDNLSWFLVSNLLFAKLLATSIMLGSGSPGGDFAPGLYMGAMLGGSFGFLMNHLFPGISSPGIYAMVGMGGVLAGQYHAPVTAIIMLFELTNNYMMILPLILTCVLSSLVARAVYPNTIYNEKLLR